MKRTFKASMSTVMRGWVGSFLVALLVATSIKSAIADWYVVPTGSMKPTILEGDRIFTNKLAYDLKIPYTRCIWRAGMSPGAETLWSSMHFLSNWIKSYNNPQPPNP